MLQIAQESGHRPVMARRIAEKQGISEPYIDQLLIPLRTNGLIRSIRGRRGGYQLAADPRRLTVLDIVEALDGRLSIIDCLDEQECTRQSVCATRVVWEQVETVLRQQLSSTTLQDLLDIEQKMQIPNDYVI